ncbi:MAG TPA: putative metallopeptidase [Burkholderiaceae bacterium]
MARTSAPRVPRRPRPPADGRMQPAAEVLEWIERYILRETGELHNPEHRHLIGADLQVMWAPQGFAKKGRTVVGTAEEVSFRSGGFERMRAEQQYADWFGVAPKFLITFAASYAADCTDAEWCALVEHELYHVAHARGLFGEPLFTKEGRPRLEIRGHDVEEFVGVVRRYGTGNPEGNLARLVEAAGRAPEVSRLQVAGACGTCLLRAA